MFQTTFTKVSLVNTHLYLDNWFGQEFTLLYCYNIPTSKNIRECKTQVFLGINLHLSKWHTLCCNIIFFIGGIIFCNITFWMPNFPNCWWLYNLRGNFSLHQYVKWNQKYHTQLTTKFLPLIWHDLLVDTLHTNIIHL